MPKLTILAYIAKNAKGPEKAKTASDIQDATGVRPPQLRAIVNTLRKEGYPIGSGQDGYFYARSYRELLPTIDHLNGRVSAINEALGGLERAFLINRRYA